MRRRHYILVAFAGLGALTAILARATCEPPAAIRDGRSVAQIQAEDAPVEPDRTGSANRVAPSQMRRLATAATGSADANADVIGTTDPTSKDYDPMTLVRAMHLTPVEIMNKEPRDSAFAGPREVALRNRITERLRKRLAFDAKVDVDCRTSSCEITLQSTAGAGDLNAAVQALDLENLANAMQLGPMERHGDSQTRGTSITMLYSAALRDHAVYDQQLRRHEANDEPPTKAP
jgi:hypothetical protein